MLANYLAEVWGISIVVIGIALLIKDRLLKCLFTYFEREDSLFLWGFVTFLIGVSMVLAYNVWAMNWQVVITVLGWASLLKGLFLLFSPELARKAVKMVESSPFLPFALLIAVFAGLAITYLGFTA